MEFGSFKSKGLVPLMLLLTRAQSTEILGGFRNDIRIQLEDDTASLTEPNRTKYEGGKFPKTKTKQNKKEPHKTGKGLSDLFKGGVLNRIPPSPKV